MVSGIHWGSWNILSMGKGGPLYLMCMAFYLSDLNCSSLKARPKYCLLHNSFLSCVTSSLIYYSRGTGPHSRSECRQASEASSVIRATSLPVARITAWAPPPVRSVAWDSHKSANPTVNCACEGSRLCASYENLMPDDLRWSWGREASTGERLQIQIIVSREVWLHRDHNKSIACRLISKPYQ